MATNVTGQFPRFLVDTGVEVSVLPPSCSERRHHDEGCNLLAVNSLAISTYGKRSLTLDLGLRRTFRWIFVIAIKSPILGTDFLRLQFVGGYETQSPRGCNHTTTSSRTLFSGVIPEPSTIPSTVHQHFHDYCDRISCCFPTPFTQPEC